MLDFEDRGVGRGLLYSSSSSSMSSNFVDVLRIPARKQIGTFFVLPFVQIIILIFILLSNKVS